MLLDDSARLQATIRHTRAESTTAAVPSPPPPPGGDVRAPTTEEVRERLRSEQIEGRRRSVVLMQLHAERGLVRTFVHRIDQEIEAVSGFPLLTVARYNNECWWLQDEEKKEKLRKYFDAHAKQLLSMLKQTSVEH